MSSPFLNRRQKKFFPPNMANYEILTAISSGAAIFAWAEMVKERRREDKVVGKKGASTTKSRQQKPSLGCGFPTLTPGS
jgi:hypothetical protein